MSEGMICSAAELAIGDDHSGILVLAPDAPLGEDFVGYAGLADQVLDISVTPNLGYALAVRGVARELATAFEVPYTDPAGQHLPEPAVDKRFRGGGQGTKGVGINHVAAGVPHEAFRKIQLPQ
jgi:phenylalanyl-tRNA synthetase beta chain